MSLTVATPQVREDHETAMANEEAHGKGEIRCECPGLRLLNRVHTWTLCTIPPHWPRLPSADCAVGRLVRAVLTREQRHVGGGVDKGRSSFWTTPRHVGGCVVMGRSFWTTPRHEENQQKPATSFPSTAREARKLFLIEWVLTQKWSGC